MAWRHGSPPASGPTVGSGEALGGVVSASLWSRFVLGKGRRTGRWGEVGLGLSGEEGALGWGLETEEQLGPGCQWLDGVGGAVQDAVGTGQGVSAEERQRQPRGPGRGRGPRAHLTEMG